MSSELISVIIDFTGTIECLQLYLLQSNKTALAKHAHSICFYHAFMLLSQHGYDAETECYEAVIEEIENKSNKLFSKEQIEIYAVNLITNHIRQYFPNFKSYFLPEFISRENIKVLLPSSLFLNLTPAQYANMASQDIPLPIYTGSV